MMNTKRMIAAFAAAVMCTAALPAGNPYSLKLPAMITASALQYGDINYTSDGKSITITGCSSSATDLIIPDTIDGLPVKAIGREAFNNNEILKNVQMPDSIEVIGSYAFWGCVNVRIEKLPENLLVIGTGAFYRCNSLIHVTIPDGVKEIPDYAFYWCDNLNTFKAGASLRTIGSHVFKYCDGLVKADLSGVETIGEETFYDCDLLTDVTVTDSIQSIGCRAFYKCPCTLDLPDRLVSVNQKNTYISYYRRTAENDLSYMCATDSGSQLIQVNDNKFFRITNLDSDDNIASSKIIPFEMPVWGGVWFSDDYNYAVYGNSNYKEDDTCEVVRIVRYTKDWERVDSTSLYGNDTYLACHSGSMRFSEYNGKLYCHSAKLKYGTSDGKHHQRNLTFVLDKKTMSASFVPDSDVYASHSFDQFVKADSSGVYYADLGDAYPRSIALSNGKKRMYDAYVIGGSIGDNYTGVSMNGMELSGDNILVAASSIDQSAEFDAEGKRNILISVTDKNLTTSTNRFITSYTADDPETVVMPRLVKKDNDTFYLLWEENLEGDHTTKTTKMVQLNGSGETASDITELGDMPLSDCQPYIDANGCITWFATIEDGNAPRIIRLDPATATDIGKAVTTEPATTATTTTTTSQQSGSTTTTTSAEQTETEFTFDLSGLVLNAGDTLLGDLSIESGRVGQVKIKYVGSDGTGAIAFIGGTLSDYLAGPGTKKMTLKATEEMRNISVIITAYGDASPQLELTVERSSEVTTSTTATTATTVTTSTTTTAVSTTTTTADDLICGDVDLSGEVSVTDIVLILQYCVNKEKYPIEGNGLINADADGDGDITPKDAYAVQLFDAKQIGSLPYKG